MRGLKAHGASRHCFVVPGSKALRLIASQTGGGVRLRATAERLGWEGIIAKAQTGRYHSGKRDAIWQKLKFVTTEELVVGGWTAPRQSRRHFGALLLGYYPEDPSPTDRLIFAGQVGSGFSQAELDRGASLLAPSHRSSVPVRRLPSNRQG